MIWFYKTSIEPCVLRINCPVLHCPLWGLLRYHMSATELWSSHHKISLQKSLNWLNLFLTWICSANTWWTLHQMKPQWAHQMVTWNMYVPIPSISLLAFFARYHCLVLYVSSPLVIIIKRSGAFKVCKHLELSLSIPHGRGACAIKTLNGFPLPAELLARASGCCNGPGNPLLWYCPWVYKTVKSRDI